MACRRCGIPPPRLKTRNCQLGVRVAHRKHARLAFAPERVDQHVEHKLPDTAGLEPLVGWRVIQQVELTGQPFVVTEHRARRHQPVEQAILPADGSFGPGAA